MAPTEPLTPTSSSPSPPSSTHSRALPPPINTSSRSPPTPTSPSSRESDPFSAAQASLQAEFRSQLAQLHQTNFPTEQCSEALLAEPDEYPISKLVDTFQRATAEASRWLEVANIVVFSLELDVREGGDLSVSEEGAQRLERLLAGFGPNVETVKELGEAIMERDNEDPSGEWDSVEVAKNKRNVRMISTKVQSESSALRHFLGSVCKEMNDVRAKKELSELMEDVLVKVDELATQIFEFQEQRHLASQSKQSETSSATSHEHPFPAVHGSTATTTTTTTTTNDEAYDLGLSTSQTFSTAPRTRDDLYMINLDSHVEPLFLQIEKIHSRMSNNPPADPTGALGRKHAVVRQRWESLRGEIDELKEEVRDDRWVECFGSMAGQAETMIEGLERIIEKGDYIVKSVWTWQESVQTASENFYNQRDTKGGLTTGTTGRNSKKAARSSFQMPIHRNKSSASLASVQSTQSVPNSPLNASGQFEISAPPITATDLVQYIKNLDAKIKYYAPTIDRLMNTLNQGLGQREQLPGAKESPRANLAAEVAKRYDALNSRWRDLQGHTNELRLCDLPDVERVLHGWSLDRPGSPVSYRGGPGSEASNGSIGSGIGGTLQRWGMKLSPEPIDRDNRGPSREGHRRPVSPFKKLLNGFARAVGRDSPSPGVERGRARTTGGRESPSLSPAGERAYSYAGYDPSKVRQRDNGAASPLSFWTSDTHRGSSRRPASPSANGILQITNRSSPTLVVHSTREKGWNISTRVDKDWLARNGNQANKNGGSPHVRPKSPAGIGPTIQRPKTPQGMLQRSSSPDVKSRPPIRGRVNSQASTISTVSQVSDRGVRSRTPSRALSPGSLQGSAATSAAMTAATVAASVAYHKRNRSPLPGAERAERPRPKTPDTGRKLRLSINSNATTRTDVSRPKASTSTGSHNGAAPSIERRGSRGGNTLGILTPTRSSSTPSSQTPQPSRSGGARGGPSSNHTSSLNASQGPSSRYRSISPGPPGSPRLVSQIPRPTQQLSPSNSHHIPSTPGSPIPTGMYYRPRSTTSSASTGHDPELPTPASSYAGEDSDALGLSQIPPYKPDLRDEVDVVVAAALNNCRIRVSAQKIPGNGGKYMFGNSQKVYPCKIQTYDGRGTTGKSRKKALVKVRGGWADLETWLSDSLVNHGY